MRSISIRQANYTGREALLIRIKDIGNGLEITTRADMPKLKIIAVKDNGEKIITYHGGEK